MYGEREGGKVCVWCVVEEENHLPLQLISPTSNLPVEEDGELPDPYVKLYLLPDRSRDSKRKTDVIKDNCSPQYDERFEYALPPNELTKRTLEVTVINKKGILFLQRSPKMGQVSVGDDNEGEGRGKWRGRIL